MLVDKSGFPRISFWPKRRLFLPKRYSQAGIFWDIMIMMIPLNVYPGICRSISRYLWMSRDILMQPSPGWPCWAAWKLRILHTCWPAWKRRICSCRMIHSIKHKKPETSSLLRLSYSPPHPVLLQTGPLHRWWCRRRRQRLCCRRQFERRRPWTYLEVQRRPWRRCFRV